LIEEQVCRDSCIGIKRKVVSILKVVADVLFLPCVDDRVDIVEVKGELREAVEEIVDICAGVTGCVRKVTVVCRAGSHLELRVLKSIRGVLSLHGSSVVERRTQPLTEPQRRKTVCYTVAYAAPVRQRTGLQCEGLLNAGRIS
jgi:hypothetical protein